MMGEDNIQLGELASNGGSISTRRLLPIPPLIRRSRLTILGHHRLIFRLCSLPQLSFGKYLTRGAMRWRLGVLSLAQILAVLYAAAHGAV